MSSSGLKRLKTKTVEIGQQLAVNFFELAKNLAKLHDDDPGSIGDIPEKTGMSRRRLYYLLDVGQLIAASGLTKIEAEEIGWTKLQIIARHLKLSGPCEAEELDIFLALARKNRARNLAKVLTGQTTQVTRIVSFELSPTDRADLNEALVAYGAKVTPRGLTGKAAALAKMAKVAISALS